MNTWLFDLGNSRLKAVALRADGRLAEDTLIEVPHAGAQLPGGALAALPPAFDSAFVASVAGDGITASLLDALAGRCTRISRVRSQRECAGVRIAYADPRRLGVDRFLALLAARARQANAALVVGVGTALTLDLLTADGRHVGGRIAPSPTLMRDALHARAPQLPATGGDYTEFADDTIDALRSGCDGAAVALVLHGLAQAGRELGERPQLLLHGGGSPPLLAQLPQAVHAPMLVLEGLACWRRAMAPVAADAGVAC
jgi:type III pantothenate kinase